MSTADQISLLALIVSVGALAATIIIALSTKREVREQLKNAQAQLDETKRQFMAQNDPDIQFDIQVRASPPDKASVRLRVTNHHPSVTVNELLVYLVGDAPTEPEAYQLMFLTFADLKPQQTLEENSLQSLDSVLAKHFLGSQSGGAIISTMPLGGASFKQYRLTLHYGYTPRYAGAKPVKGTKDFLLNVSYA